MDKGTIEVRDLSKVYYLYDKPSDRIRETFSIRKKKYSKEHYALKNFNLKINKGESIGIVGTNGSGKSTLLKLVTGVVTPTTGTIKTDGKIAALLELGAGFNPEYTGIENIYLNGTMMGYTEEEMKKRVGVIDCPDLPLNVSRSALQNDGFVKKISDYITKKVADKLSGMCKTDKENYEKYWDDINPFIKFGCLKDEKFAEKMNDYIIFKNLDGKYLTLKECLEENKEKHENTVFYVTDEIEQSQYINMFKNEGIDAVILTHNIDQPFITNMESKNENLKFKRIDADLSDSFKIGRAHV